MRPTVLKPQASYPTTLFFTDIRSCTWKVRHRNSAGRCGLTGGDVASVQLLMLK